MASTEKSILKKILMLIAVLAVMLIVTVSLGFLIASKYASIKELQASQGPEQKPLTNVVTLKLIPQLVQDRLNLPGVARPWISLKVVSEIRGLTIEKRVEQGQAVEKGDVLAVVDKRDYQNAYDSAYASWETAVTNKKRLDSLVKKSFVTQSQLDDAIAAVKTTKAALENARLNLNRCVIRSPMKGIVDRVFIENGTFLNPGDPVCQVLKIDQVKIQVGIPESDVDAVRNLKSFDITIDALNKKTFTGRFHYLYHTSDTMARLYTLEIEVDNPDYLILPDMFARVKIVKEQDEQGLAVPMYSLVSRDESIGVYVEKEGQVTFRKVVQGYQDGWRIQIPQGLSAGDHIVVVGQKIVADGENVNVTRTVESMKEIYQ